MSKFIPNSYQVPNWYTDRYQGLLHPNEWAILTYAMRRIFGFQKRSDRISLSQFSSGVQSKDGKKLDFGTGLSEATCRKYLRNLQEYNLIIEVEINNPRKNEGALWSLQLDSDLVNDDAIMAAFNARNKKDGQRTRAGLEAIKQYWKEQKGGNVTRKDITSHVTTPLTCDVTTLLMSHVSHNKQIKNSINTDIAANAASPMPATNGTTTLNGSSGKECPPPGSGAPPQKKDVKPYDVYEALVQIEPGIVEGHVLKEAKLMLDGDEAKNIPPCTLDQIVRYAKFLQSKNYYIKHMIPINASAIRKGIYLWRNAGEPETEAIHLTGNGRTDDIEREWQAIKLAAAQPGRPDISERALRAIQLHVPGGWHTFKQQNVNFFDQLKPVFKEAYERVATTQPA